MNPTNNLKTLIKSAKVILALPFSAEQLAKELNISVDEAIKLHNFCEELVLY